MFAGQIPKKGRGMSRASGHSSLTGGFTLIELMLVVAVIAIITAMAIPGILNARIAANESSAIATMRTVATVNEQYRVRFQSDPGAITDLSALEYIDPAVASPTKAGYTFSYSGGVNTYTFRGDPTNPGQSGYRYFYVDPSGVIRYNTGVPAGPGDNPVGDK